MQNLIHKQMELNEAAHVRPHRQRAAATPDVASQLEKLEGMLDRGTLTPEEFEDQKRKLLG